MNDKLVFGQYFHSNSVIHRIDARVKLFSLIVLMVAIFLIPTNDYQMAFILLGISFSAIIVVILISKVPILKYLKSIKQIAFLLMFTFVFQLFMNKDDLTPLLDMTLNFSIFNISLVVIIVIIYFALRKYLPFKLLLLFGIIAFALYLFQFPMIGNAFTSTKVTFYQSGLISGSFIVLRIFFVIMLSTTLTLTTQPMDLANALDWYLKPLELIGIKTSIFSMMISIALRFIPTLFNETDKILKAQASRGSAFNEGKLKDQIRQIISLLIPMFAISIKRATDLADAIDARGYIPGAKRTRLQKSQFALRDLIAALVVVGLLITIIVMR